MKTTLLLTVTICIALSLGFNVSSRKSFTGSKMSLKMIGMKANEEKAKMMRDQLPLTLKELYTPPFADGFSIGWILVGQGILASLSYFAQAMFQYFDKQLLGLDTISFDLDSMLLALYVSGPFIFGEFILNKIPGKPFEDICREKRTYVLKLFGVQSNLIETFFLTVLLSASTAFSQELFFRGIIMHSIANYTGPLTALLISSVLYAFLIFPLWGIFLGLGLGYGYWISGFNLAVPIAAFTLYDLLTKIITWEVEKDDLNGRMRMAIESEVSRLSDLNSGELESVSESIFNILDLNKDGSISFKELDSGLKLYGKGIVPEDGYDVKLLFDKADLNKDGLIDQEEFCKIIRDDAKTLKIWGLIPE